MAEGRSYARNLKITLLASFLGVSTEWLLNGSESAAKENSSIRISSVKFRDGEKKESNVRIPIYKDIRASCGDGIENFSRM